MGPFDLIKLFYNKSEYNKLSNYDKAKHYFIINRMMGVQFPAFAAFLSINKISPSGVVDFWNFYLPTKFKYYPNWLYIKTKRAKEAKQIKSSEYHPSKEVLNYYSKLHQCSMKEIDESLRRFPDKMKDELKNLEAYFK